MPGSQAFPEYAIAWRACCGSMQREGRMLERNRAGDSDPGFTDYRSRKKDNRDHDEQLVHGNDVSGLVDPSDGGEALDHGRSSDNAFLADWQNAFAAPRSSPFPILYLDLLSFPQRGVWEREGNSYPSSVMTPIGALTHGVSLCGNRAR